ncbi:MAG TPA: transglutaminase family protein [Propionibacteriaceae bacterium]|nr:transglutaminase family protein [Propionibacteriaceae bacterium]
MRLSIDHQTGFHYSSPVASSYNEARMIPVGTSTQAVWSSRVSIEPQPWSFSYTDYWGTNVTSFELHEPHERLTVRAQAVVDTRGDDLPWDTDRRVGGGDLGWPALHDRGVIDSMAEYLTFSYRTRPPEELAALAAETVQQPPRLAGLDICRMIGDRLSYARGSTAVNSSAADVWAGGRGVCQDYTHLALAALRSVGLPARYVSGYLHPKASREPGLTVSGESHSWVEWWCGSWVAFDPTAQRRLSDSYVRVGHGRDYGDVAPLRGTYSGGSSDMFVTVEMTQLG